MFSNRPLGLGVEDNPLVESPYATDSTEVETDVPPEPEEEP